MFCTLVLYYRSSEIFQQIFSVEKFPNYGSFYFIDEKFKVKYFRGCMTSSKHFHLEHTGISLAIIYARSMRSLMLPGLAFHKLIRVIRFLQKASFNCSAIFAGYVQDLVQNLASLARKILGRF